MRILKKCVQANNAISFVLTNQFKFQGNKYRNLLASMKKPDQKEFSFDPRHIKWNDYIKDYHYGIAKYITNEKIGTCAANKKLNRFKYANYFITALTFMILLFAIKEIYFCMNKIQNIETID